VGGGFANAATGQAATVPGGQRNLAAGDFSLAAGHHARAFHRGSFVWADSDGTEFLSTGENQFSVRATGGTSSQPAVRFVTAVDSEGQPTAGVKLARGANAWSVLSDRAVKQDFEPVDGGQVLEKLAAIPIATWSYQSQDPSVRHIGPMAQDFAAAFGVGEDERHISTVDADGVALAAIQGLHQLLQEQEVQIATQQEKISTLEARLTALEQQAGTNRVQEASLLGSGIPSGLLFLGGLALAGLSRWHRGGRRQD
jgi:hypothetical protein